MSETKVNPDEVEEGIILVLLIFSFIVIVTLISWAVSYNIHAIF